LLSVCPYPLNVAREWFGEHAPAAMNTNATIELLDAVFCTWSVLYQILDM
jgi:hypothetical protein